MLRYVTNNHSGIWHIRMWTKSVWNLQYFLLSWIIFDFISWSCMFSCRRSYSCCMLIAAYVYLARVTASPRRCLNFITCLYGSSIVSCCRCRRRCTMWYCATLELSIYVLYIFVVVTSRCFLKRTWSTLILTARLLTTRWSYRLLCLYVYKARIVTEL